MDKNELLDYLGKYGYPLMKPALTSQPEEVLEALLEQDETRLVEGFPVVLAHALEEKDLLAWENPKWNPKRELSEKSQNRLACLLVLSRLLFEQFGLEKRFLKRTLKLQNKMKMDPVFVDKLRDDFEKSHSVPVQKMTLSIERLKNHFTNYVVHSPEREEGQKKKHALELELLLSELFTARQKELLQKRLDNKPFTKTEREYFYRVVKKRLKALASDELHQMACGLLLR